MWFVIWWRRSNPMRRSLPVRGDPRTWCLMVKVGKIQKESFEEDRPKRKKKNLIAKAQRKLWSRRSRSWPFRGTLWKVWLLCSLSQIQKTNFSLFIQKRLQPKPETSINLILSESQGNKYFHKFWCEILKNDAHNSEWVKFHKTEHPRFGYKEF